MVCQATTLAHNCEAHTVRIVGALCYNRVCGFVCMQLLALQQEDADWQEVHACYNGAEPVTRLRAGKLSSMQSVSAAHDERMARVSALQAQLQDEKAKLAVCKAQLQGPQHNAIGDQRALAQ